MTENAIRSSLEKKRLKLTFGQIESHYSIVLVFFIPHLIVFYILIKNWITGNITTIHPNFLNVLIVGTLLGIIAFWYQRRQLKFTEIESSTSEKRFQELINKVEEKEDWYMMHESENAIIIKTLPKWTSGSWGEQITILRDGKRTLVNSICDPDKHVSVFSAGRNSSNVEGIKNFFDKIITN